MHFVSLLSLAYLANRIFSHVQVAPRVHHDEQAGSSKGPKSVRRFGSENVPASATELSPFYRDCLSGALVGGASGRLGYFDCFDCLKLRFRHNEHKSPDHDSFFDL
jgi:hypothetical protein